MSGVLLILYQNHIQWFATDQNTVAGAISGYESMIAHQVTEQMKCLHYS
jgi:hypothetical protein